ncbi:MAG: hypothetical protein CMQ11_09085 [Gammaproteobacteria bacterium]|nr:hypothetical protein [Gammaproteobacteria bacterium]
MESWLTDLEINGLAKINVSRGYFHVFNLLNCWIFCTAGLSMVQLGQKCPRDARQARIYSLGRPAETGEPAGGSRVSVLSCNSKAFNSSA